MPLTHIYLSLYFWCFNNLLTSRWFLPSFWSLSSVNHFLVSILLMLRNPIVQNLILAQALGLYNGHFWGLAESLGQVEIYGAARGHDLSCLEGLLSWARNIVDVDQESLLIVLLLGVGYLLSVVQTSVAEVNLVVERHILLLKKLFIDLCYVLG